MTQKRRILFLVILIIIAAAINAIKTQNRVSQKEFTTQVLDQYIKYYCPNAGTCSREKALSSLRSDWPQLYSRGFSILENNETQ
ncbi:hypothetical protein HZB78_06135 [Candidatus Collierbacteria bacterium]|nr:hypothetical protein [Candidatus Collierbacteria bacterium]